MQPTLLVTSGVSGLLYVNGRLAGEIDQAHSACLPVAAFGPIYLELRPMEAGHLPLACRLTLSGGKPIASSLDAQQGLFVGMWPGGVLEVELSAERLPEECASPAYLMDGDLRAAVYTGARPRLTVSAGGAHYAYALAPGARPPELIVRPECYLFRGELEGGGEYALALSQDLSRVLISLTGQRIGVDDQGALSALVAADDIVGHANLETWGYEAQGYQLLAREAIWAAGAPKWPATPEDTALAAVQAAQLDLLAEASGYFAPHVPCEAALAAVRAWDGCLPMRYALPDGRPAIALYRMIGERLVEFAPLYFRAGAGGGTQGIWRLEALSLE